MTQNKRLISDFQYLLKNRINKKLCKIQGFQNQIKKSSMHIGEKNQESKKKMEKSCKETMNIKCKAYIY